ncbi:hypothetical protein AAVH_22142 [Aphelenchoides avenae]|nr:hypothetical protein AAVH_22142 [Aphelenchus avenae]
MLDGVRETTPAENPKPPPPELACGIGAIGGADNHLIFCLKEGNGISNGLYELTKAPEAAEAQELAAGSRDSNSKHRTRTIPAM